MYVQTLTELCVQEYHSYYSRFFMYSQFWLNWISFSKFLDDIVLRPKAEVSAVWDILHLHLHYKFLAITYG